GTIGGAVEDASSLERTYDAQVKPSVRHTCAKAALEVGLQADDLPVFRSNGTCRCTVVIIIAGILHLDHTHVAARLKDITMRIFRLPEADALIVVDHIDGMSHKPPVALISFRARIQRHQFVAVSIEVDARFPGPSVGLEDQSVQADLDTFVLGLSDVFRYGAYT